jgi:hypothetical protein
MADKYDIPSLRGELEVDFILGNKKGYSLTIKTYSYCLISRMRELQYGTRQLVELGPLPDQLFGWWKLAAKHGFTYMERELRTKECRAALRLQFLSKDGFKNLLAEGIPVDILGAAVRDAVANRIYIDDMPPRDLERCDCGNHLWNSDSNSEYNSE